MAGLCTNHVAVVALCFLLLLPLLLSGHGQRTLVRTSKDHVGQARINQERSQRGLKCREQHMLVSLKGVKTIFVNLMCDKRNENACEEPRLASRHSNNSRTERENVTNAL